MKPPQAVIVSFGEQAHHPIPQKLPQLIAHHPIPQISTTTTGVHRRAKLKIPMRLRFSFFRCLAELREHTALTVANGYYLAAQHAVLKRLTLFQRLR